MNFDHASTDAVFGQRPIWITTATANTGAGPYYHCNAWLEDLRYREGWSFQLAQNPPGTTGWDRPTLIVRARVKESTGAWAVEDPDGMVIITHAIDLPPCNLYDEDDFMRAVLMAIIRIETHEAMEFAKYKGRRIVDPHLANGVVLYHLPQPKNPTVPWPYDWQFTKVSQ